MASTSLASGGRFLFSETISPSNHAQADHGNVAVLPSGASCMPWSYSTGNRYVSCRVVEVSTSKLGARSASAVFALGIPGTSVYGGGESCEKPWVTRLSDTEFVVTWERQATAVNDGRIECARIYRDTDGSWAVDQPSEGIGYQIGLAAAPGDSDCNCRSIWLENGYFFISHATETANTAGPPHERTHTLRTAAVRWLSSDEAPVSVATAAYAGIHFDDTNNLSSGGFALSHSFVTRRGDVVVGWEQRDYQTGTTFNSTIELRKLSGLYSAAPLTEIATLSTIVTMLTTNTLALRRPQFASLHPLVYRSQATVSGGGSEAIWTYGYEDVGVPGNTAAQLGVLNLYSGGAISNTARAWEANDGLNAPLDATGSSCAFMSRKMQGAICVAKYDTSAGRLFSMMHADGTGLHERLGTSCRWPDRPSVFILPVEGGELFYLTYEGFDVAGGESSSRRFLDVYFVAD